jgi:hypothetical protein
MQKSHVFMNLICKYRVALHENRPVDSPLSSKKSAHLSRGFFFVCHLKMAKGRVNSLP